MQSRRVPRSNGRSIASTGLVIALALATVVAVPIAAIVLAAKLSVSATSSARTRLAIAAPAAPVLVAAAAADDDIPTGSIGSRGFTLASAGETILPRADARAGTTVLVKTMPVSEPAMPPVAAVEVLRKRGWPDRPSAPPKAPAAIAAALAPASKRTAEPDKVPLAAPAKLAYAKPDLDVLPSVPAPLSITPGPVRSARDIRTAVYDIEAHTVYLPSGRKLEAHSGLGDFMDDPSSLKRKNRGVTPPNTYDLKLRESLFHGVQAIRMTPVDEDAMFGRDGILAHSYMLGPNGQSNGCVSFRNYPEFLKAFQRGEVDRIVVLPRNGAERAAQLHGRPVNKYAFGG